MLDFHSSIARRMSAWREQKTQTPPFRERIERVMVRTLRVACALIALSVAGCFSDDANESATDGPSTLSAGQAMPQPQPTSDDPETEGDATETDMSDDTGVDPSTTGTGGDDSDTDDSGGTGTGTGGDDSDTDDSGGAGSTTGEPDGYGDCKILKEGTPGCPLNIGYSMPDGDPEDPNDHFWCHCTSYCETEDDCPSGYGCMQPAGWSNSICVDFCEAEDDCPEEDESCIKVDEDALICLQVY